jgi:hypothetical protein
VRLGRPCKKGERYRISGSAFASVRRAASADGRVLADETEGFKAEFAADVAVLELGPEGDLIKEALTISNCRVQRDGSTRQLFPKGTVVVVALENGRRVFRVNGQPVDDKAEQVVDMMSAIGPSHDALSDDQVFGTAEQRKVGDSWSVNSASAVKSLREETKIRVSEEDMHGVVTIEKKTTCGNEECLIISGKLDADLVTVDTDELRLDSGEAHFRISGAFPVDTSHRAVDRAFEMQMRASGRVKRDPKGPELQIDVTKETKMTAHYTTL